MTTDSYKPISDYGIIGNLRSTALVASDGSIDWCCFPHLDRESVFAALLDSKRGGRFAISPRERIQGEQFYLEETNILCTRFSSSKGVVRITDFMPISGDIYGFGKSTALPEIHRLVECDDGEVEMEVAWSPCFDYARKQPKLQRVDEGWIASAGSFTMSLAGLSEGDVEQGEGLPEVRASFTLKAGQNRALITRWSSRDTRSDPTHCLEALAETKAIWNEWAHREGRVESREWAGEFRDLVTRSALVCKLLCHADTGAIAAAPTTSLPETIGGSRNWDYRYSWIRDASLTAQALIAMGHGEEAINLLNWMERVSEQRFHDTLRLQIMYGLHGEAEIPEIELPHLEGYRKSRPVRIGNGAAEQFQLEIYGELLNTGYEMVRRGQELPPSLWGFLRKVVEHVQQVWREPDFGIWEVRGEPRHFTYSKVMAWVAFDRAIRLCEHSDFSGDVEEWKRARAEVKREVLERAFDEDLGSFVAAYDCRQLDAAVLRIPMLEFLPPDDRRVLGTIDRALRDLTENGLVHRYDFDDGLPGEEGAFGLCTFWLIDALALAGRTKEARDLLEKMVGHAGPLGLFPEEFNPADGEFLGNFPQAFTHIGFINSVLYLAYAEGREIPEHAPIGSSVHRQKKAKGRCLTQEEDRP